MTHSSEWLVLALLRASAGLSIAALLVSAGVRLLRLRAPRSEQCAWFLVLLHGVMLVPVFIPVHTSFLSAGRSRLPGSVPDGAPRANIQSAELADPAPRVSNGSEGQATDRTPNLRQSALAPLGQDPSSPTRFSWTLGALMVWLAGIASLMGVAFVRYARFVRQLRLARTIAPEWRDEWRRVLDEHSIHALIPLVASRDAGPALCRLPGGYRLVVPEPLWAELAPAERITILRHELAHYRRGDLWSTLGARCVALVHWFNPLAWWAVSRFEAQCEFICDRASATADPTALAEILMRLGSRRRARIAVVQAVRSGSVFERVQRLFDRVRPGRLAGSALRVAITVLALAPSTVRCHAVAVADPVEQKANDAIAKVESDPLPPRALLRIGTDILRSRDFPITGIAFSPDGKLLAAAVANTPVATATLFDVSTGRQVKQIRLPAEAKGWITCVAFSPDGLEARFGAKSEGRSQCGTGLTQADQLLFREKVHGARVNDVVVDLAGCFGTVNDVDLVSRRPPRPGMAPSVRLRRAGNPREIVVSGLRDLGARKDPRIWGTQRSLLCSQSALSAWRSRPTEPGSWFGPGPTPRFPIWRTKDGELLRQIERAHGDRTGASQFGVGYVAVTPDGRRIVSAGACVVPITQTRLKYGARNVNMSEVRVWDLDTGGAVDQELVRRGRPWLWLCSPVA